MPTPRTWVAAETVTASIMNSAIRDVFNYVLVAPVQADVATSQTTTSTTFTDLATVGPTVAGITLEAGQDVLVILHYRGTAGGTTQGAYMGFAVSGAETDAATDADAALKLTAEGDGQMTKITVYTAGTAGSHTFTAKYRSTDAGATATFRDRRIIVKPF